MNLILFEPNEVGRRLPLTDRRSVHLREVLGRERGGSFDAGLTDGRMGKGTVVDVGAEGLAMTFAWNEPAPVLDRITLLVGLPRPQTARKILQEVTALGIEAIHFVRTAKGDPGYAQSKLWTTGEWRRHVMLGAEQAFNPRLPEIRYGEPLAEAVAVLPGGCRVALDNYEAPQGLGQTEVALPLSLAIGPERGWSTEERDLLRSQGFALSHLGARVLRVETACVAALAIARTKLGLI